MIRTALPDVRPGCAPRAARAVFLDRDGTLNAEVGFVAERSQLQILPGVREAVRALAGAGFALIVVTNQSGIARGLYGQCDLAHMHEWLHRELDELPLAYLHCPHHPDVSGPYGGACACRKPQSGLLHQACELLGVEFAGGYLLGDSARDLLMGRGLPLTTIQLLCGKPPTEQRLLLEAAGVVPDHVAADLPAAAAWILARQARRA